MRFGLDHPRKDLEQNTIATFNVLEAMRANGVNAIAFASTGSIYGDATLFPTPEDAPFPGQTSLYGASKLAAEGLIAAYCEGFGMQAWIFRFASILGERYTHGHVFDFYAAARRSERAWRCSATGASVNPIFTSATASTRSSSHAAHPREVQSFQPRYRRILRGQRFPLAGSRRSRYFPGNSFIAAASAVGLATVHSFFSIREGSGRSVGSRTLDPRGYRQYIDWLKSNRWVLERRLWRASRALVWQTLKVSHKHSGCRHMRVTVAVLWHLGCVTAACLARRRA